MMTLTAQVQEADPNVGDEVVTDPNAEADPIEGQEGEEDAAPQLDPIEQLAAEMGWKPKADWKGDPTTWTPAADFIRNKDQVLRRTQVHNRSARREADDLRERMHRLERTNEEFNRRTAAAIRAEFESAKFDAAKAGDDKQYEALVKEQNEFEAQQQREAAQPANIDVERVADETLSNPALARFYTDNSWILQVDDDGPYQYAVGIANEVVAKGGTQVQAVAEAERALRYAFPQMYAERRGQTQLTDEQPRDPNTGQFVPRGQAPNGQQQQQQRRAPAHVANGARTATKDTGIQGRIAKLPAEAKRALDAEVARGHKAEDWLKIYEGSA